MNTRQLTRRSGSSHFYCQTKLRRVVSNSLNNARLERVDGVGGIAGEVVADVADRLEIEQREVLLALKLRRHRRRETQ